MDRLQAADAVAAQFEVTDQDVQRCFEEFLVELNTVYQIPTYITRVAYGTEKGFCLSVDLGGPDFQVCSVTLNGDSTYTTRQTKLIIPKDLMVARQARDLFSFVAGHVRAFLEDNHPDQLARADVVNLGFCFSFPVYQTSVNSGVLVRWTKGFDIDDAVGKDVCQLLQTELDNLNLPVRVTAIVNDTLGTAMTRAYTLPVSKTRTSVGAIFSTGTNGAYLEKLSKITKDIGQHDATTGEMFLNTEWGSFDSNLNVLSNTPYDEAVDHASSNKGNQIFEKRVSGMFLGELLRLAVERLYDDPKAGLFPNYRRGDKSLMLRSRWSVDTTILSIAETDKSPKLDALKSKIQNTFGVPGWAITLQDTQAIQKISRAIGRRAGRLAGTAIGAVIHQSGKLRQADSITLPVDGAAVSGEGATGEAPIVDVAVDGSVVEQYPGFEAYMREALRAIHQIGPDGERRIRIGLTKDGSSIGTAIIALLAAQQTALATP